MTIGENIRNARKAAGLTQEQLAEKCGTADSAIRKYESGRLCPRWNTARKIAEALGIEPAEVYDVGERTQEFDDEAGEEDKAVGMRIRVERVRCGLSQEELAEKVGVTRVSIGNYERGDRNISLTVAKKIAEALNLDVMELCGGEEKRTEKTRTIRENLRIERERLGLNKAEAARMLGVPYSTYDGYEKGYRTPDIDVLHKISDVFGISIHKLIDEQEEEQMRDVIIQLDTDMDGDLIDHLESIRNVNGYLKALIRADIAISKAKE